MYKEAMVIIDGQKLFVAVRVQRYWARFREEQTPDVIRWKSLILGLDRELQTQFISLLLAQRESDDNGLAWIYR